MIQKIVKKETGKTATKLLTCLVGGAVALTAYESLSNVQKTEPRVTEISPIKPPKSERIRTVTQVVEQATKKRPEKPFKF